MESWGLFLNWEAISYVLNFSSYILTHPLILPSQTLAVTRLRLKYEKYFLSNHSSAALTMPGSRWQLRSICAWTRVLGGALWCLVSAQLDRASLHSELLTLWNQYWWLKFMLNRLLLNRLVFKSLRWPRVDQNVPFVHRVLKTFIDNHIDSYILLLPITMILIENFIWLSKVMTDQLGGTTPPPDSLVMFRCFEFPPP